MALDAVAGLTSLCEARGVTQDFPLPNGRPRRVLEDVSLAVRPNEVVALLGPSGCGKSTLLRILAGLLAPTGGDVLYRGQPMKGLNPGAGMVFQSFALYPWMTVVENVEAVLQAAGLPREEVARRARQAIESVGLAASGEAYPRELSGGMKQRVGIARALSIDPEILFMDEPFSQVDALTAESLRAEVVDLWSAHGKNPSAVIMVSHDIKEVVFMADRVVVLGANPGRVIKVVENRLPRPRDYRSPEFLRLVDQLHEVITGHEMPDAPPPPAGAPPPFEPLPFATPGEMVGLLEYLGARGGREDIFRIAADTNREFGRVIAVVKASEMLELVDTPSRSVILTPSGRRFLDASGDERKVQWRDELLKLRLFQDLRDLVARQPERRIDAELAQETIILRMPYEDYEKVFEVVVAWARFGGLFAFDEPSGRLSLP